jgi:hypothetical protein
VPTAGSRPGSKSQVSAAGGNLQGLDPTAGAVEKCNGCALPPTTPQRTRDRLRQRTRGDPESGRGDSADSAEFPLQLLDLVAQPGGFFEP